MKKAWLIFFLPILCEAQTDCKDPYRLPDTYYQINMVQYSPVCGCDGFTYRNEQAAYWWGGINYWTANTICDDFDIDVYPSLSTSTSTERVHLRIFMKYAGTATVTIYSSFGKLMFTKLFATSSPGQIMPEANPYDLDEVDFFPRGIYLLIVTVNGEKKYRKIIRATE